jgi:hypothetical protein
VTLELRQDENDMPVASYLLIVFAPSRPGKRCVGLLLLEDASGTEGVTDCSGKRCVATQGFSSCKFFGDYVHLRDGLLGEPQLFPLLVEFHHF